MCKAQKIKIQSTNSQSLHMFEVRVNAGGTNVALHGIEANQSSTWNDNIQRFGPLNSVDDSIETFSCTQPLPESWWEVTLDGSHFIDSVEILNRYCTPDPADPNGCLCRLSNAQVHIINELGTEVIRQLGDTCGVLKVVEDFSSACSTQVSTHAPSLQQSLSPTTGPSKSPSSVSTSGPTRNPSVAETNTPTIAEDGANPLTASPDSSPKPTTRMPIDTRSLTVSPTDGPSNSPNQRPTTPKPTTSPTVSSPPSTSPQPTEESSAKHESMEYLIYFVALVAALLA